MNGQTEYTYSETITFPGAVAKIFRPVLTDEERSRRTKELHQATINILKEVEKMSKYDDPNWKYKVVAERQAEKLKQGQTEEQVIKYLKFCYWNDEEIEKIIRIARKYIK